MMLAVLVAMVSLAAPPAEPPVSPKPAPAPAAEAPAPAPAPALDLKPVIPEPEIPKSEPPELAGEELNLGWTLVRTIIVLGMVIGLVYLSLNVGLRKLLGIKPVVGTSLVTVLERVSLDQKRSLFVVQAAGEVLLIGGSENSLTLISKLDAAEVDKLRAQPNAPAPIQLSPFLQKLLGKKDAPPPPAN